VETGVNNSSGQVADGRYHIMARECGTVSGMEYGTWLNDKYTVRRAALLENGFVHRRDWSS
jgi:hypothetical protein